MVYRTRTSIRQRQVLVALSYGRTYQEIGDDLGIGVESVRTHVKAMFRKLDVNDAAQAVRVGFERGLLQPREAA